MFTLLLALNYLDPYFGMVSLDYHGVIAAIESRAYPFHYLYTSFF